MATMRRVETTAPGVTDVREVAIPDLGERDVLVRIRACGICGSDTAYIAMGGLGGVPMPLGHEAAGVIVATGAAVNGLEVGDHVVVNPMAAPSGVIGNGGTLGALAEYLLIENAELGTSVAIIPKSVPFEVAALNEPMAVARHMVNRAQPQPHHRAAVFGAGPIGLGATIWLKLSGVRHVVVIDVLGERLDRALAVGADAVVNPLEADTTAVLQQLHGTESNRIGQNRAGTDLYLDAAGVGSVIQTTIDNAKSGAVLVTAAMHKHPVSVDVGAMLAAELTWTTSMGYPTEIFEVTDELVEHAELFKKLISHVVTFDDVDSALKLATTPGAAEKVIVTFP